MLFDEYESLKTPEKEDVLTIETSFLPDHHLPRCPQNDLPLHQATCPCSGPARDDILHMWAEVMMTVAIKAD